MRLLLTLVAALLLTTGCIHRHHNPRMVERATIHVVCADAAKDAGNNAVNCDFTVLHTVETK